MRIIAMGGAMDFKVGTKQFCTPLFQMWGYKQANSSRGFIEICCLVVALINIGRHRPSGVGVRLKVGDKY